MPAVVNRTARVVLAAVLLLSAALVVPTRGEERRVALLIGNSDYEGAPLTNPARDVRRLGATLQALGFHLVGGTPKENLGKPAMERALRDFRAYLGPDTVALFYFSGHGLSIRDTSYLVPVAVEPPSGEEAAEAVFVNVRDIVTAMGASGSRLSMILLDACRSVVFRTSIRERTSPGLAALQAPGSVLINYSTQPGSVASDGDPNAESGPYVAALTEALVQPGISFIEVFNRAGLLVSERSEGKQRPWLSLSPIAGEFVFLAQGAAPPRLGAPPPRPAPAPTVAGYRDCAGCPEMVSITPARFEMGSDKGEPDEQPVHAVTLARPFSIGRTEVTFAEWDACVTGGGCRHRPEDMRWGRGRQPVINVSWQDAQDYARWLSQRSGKRYRLPSEAEWEHVARAGGPPPDRPILFGVANCHGCGSEWDHRQPGPVASFRANALGVHDMLGNVWEWVEDCYAPGYADAPADGAPATGGSCAKRVVRGGSWADRAGLVRPTNRGAVPPMTRNPLIGFRVARDD